MLGRRGLCGRLMAAGRNDDFDDRSSSRTCISQPQAAAQLGDALTHAANADADAFRMQSDYAVFDSFTVIPYSDRDVAVLLGQAHVAIPGAGMAEHVRERLLHDAEDRGFQFGPQPAQVGGSTSRRTAMPLRSDNPSRNQRNAETNPTSSSSGGCSKCEIVRTC